MGGILYVLKENGNTHISRMIAYAQFLFATRYVYRHMDNVSQVLKVRMVAMRAVSEPAVFKAAVDPHRKSMEQKP